MNLKSKNFSTIKGLVKKFIGLPLTIISFFFIARLMYNNWDTIVKSFAHFKPITASLGIMLIALFFGIKAYIYHLLLKEADHPIPLRHGLYLYSIAEVKRYTPGNIFSFLARIMSYESLSIPKSVTLKLILVETVLLVGASAAASIPSLSILDPIIRHYINPNIVYGIAITGFILIIVAGLFFLKKKHIAFPHHVIDLFAAYIAAWALFGIGNYLIAISFTTLDPHLFLQFSSFFILSWLVGYLSFVTPMGLGVREAIVTVGLASYIPLSVAGSLSLLLRIGMIAGELLLLGFITVLHKAHSNNKIFTFLRKADEYKILLVSLITTYIAYFSYFSFQKHLLFLTGRYDLGNMEQTVWNTLHGRFFILTHPDVNTVTSRLAVHADFILVLIAPFYALWQDARTLLLIQTIIIGVGAWYVYRIAENVLDKKSIALVLAFSYLLNPFVQEQNLFDFHAVSLATTFLLAAFYYLLSKNNKLFILTLLLAVSTKEHIWAIAAFFGIYIFFKRSKMWGSILTLASFGMFYLLISQFIPDARSGDHFALSFYDELGSSPKEILFKIILQPHTAVQLAIKNNMVEYLKYILLPTGFLSLLAPLYLLFALPEFAINLLSNNQNLRSYQYHYAAAIIPFVYISAIYGIKRIVQFKPHLILRKGIVYYILFATLYSQWSFGLLPGTKEADLAIYASSLKNAGIIKNYLDTIPENVSVGATNNVAAHLIKRQKIYTLPYAVGKADLLVFLVDHIDSSKNSDAQLAQTISRSSEYKEVYRINDFRVFEKRK